MSKKNCPTQPTNGRRDLLSSLVVFALGIVGLFIASIASSGIGPDWFNNVDLTIASLSGVLLGGGLSPLLDNMGTRRDRFRVSLVVFMFGIVYFAIPTIASFELEQWSRNVYLTGGGAAMGAALGVMLSCLRR